MIYTSKKRKKVVKKTILLLTLAIGFVATNTAAQNRHREHTEQTAYKQCGHRNYHHHYYRQPSYMVINGKVFFDGHNNSGRPSRQLHSSQARLRQRQL